WIQSPARPSPVKSSGSRASEPGLPPLRVYGQGPCRGDGAFLFQFANQLVNLLGQQPFGPDGGVQILPSFRTTREPIQYPVAQRTKIRLRLEQELLIRVV